MEVMKSILKSKQELFGVSWFSVSSCQTYHKVSISSSSNLLGDLAPSNMVNLCSPLIQIALGSVGT